MTLRHFAYELAPDVRAQLLGRVPGGSAFPDGLRKCAAAAVARSDPVMREFLVAVRYDPGWLKDDAASPSRQAQWLLLCLAQGLKKVASLGREAPLHHLVLAAACPILGWGQEDIDLLLRGEPLGDYLRRLGLECEGIEHLNDIAGCLDSSRREALEAKLQASLNRIAQSAPGPWADGLQRALTPLSFGGSKTSAAAEARVAIEAARDMLSSCSGPRHHLLLILD